MVEEYNFIIMNDVLEIMSRLMEKLAFDYHMLYKAKHP
jgi:hypothetical protein